MINDGILPDVFLYSNIKVNVFFLVYKALRKYNIMPTPIFLYYTYTKEKKKIFLFTARVINNLTAAVPTIYRYRYSIMLYIKNLCLYYIFAIIHIFIYRIKIHNI